MVSKVDVIKNSELIGVIHSGNVTLDERVNVIHDICTDFYNPNAKLRILIDSRLVTHVMTQVEQNIFGSYLASREELKLALIAVIVNKDQVINQKVIDISSRKGHKIKLFFTESEALIWLNASLS